MASPVIPGLRHLLPVLSSTASVSFCFTEYWTLIPFLKPSIPPQSLASFWDSYLYQTIPGWVGFGLTSAISGYISYRNTTGFTKTLYGWGTVFALGHYTFGYTVSQVIKGVVHGPSEEAKDGLRYWLKLHTVRTLLVDIPAMICFVGGFMHCVWVRG